ncbi:MAG: ribonuclease HII [Gammaproteobacteria bacterium RIFCSPLOWO2_01_FULL_47_190]|nr:MAG: ribonuclease HII [Gammaproteobacteria bacterium RIFCSPLOWO2_01_FULL_47_190]
MQGPEYKIPENAVIAGVDEVGRGPLAGPVIAAAVILDPERPIYGLADSKSINEKKRQKLAQEIMLKSRAWAIARAEVYEIDELNILQASLLAMCRSVDALNIKPGLVLVDGNQCPEMELPVKAIIKGDTKVAAISAASIIAKVARDREMTDLDHEYPGYGFAVHKGYPTMAHIQALKQLGACPIHRRSFAPVKYLSQN